jgi:cytochrome b pre-mRNA-processing protein 3
MIFSFLRRAKPAHPIEPLYGAIMAAALHPDFYVRLGAKDTFEGRFEAAALHVSLVLRRLKSLGAPAEEPAQQLVDLFFDGLDAAMRQQGVSDVGVPKRMKTFAKGFYGRLQAYTEALQPDAPPMRLSEALGRNLLGGEEASLALALYVRTVVAGLDKAAFDRLIGGPDEVFGDARQMGAQT